MNALIGVLVPQDGIDDKGSVDADDEVGRAGAGPACLLGVLSCGGNEGSPTSPSIPPPSNPPQQQSFAVARVRVAPTPAVLPADAAGKHRALLAELVRVPAQTTVVRRYRFDGSPLVRDVQAGWRTGRQALVLEGNFDVLGEVLAVEG